MKMHRHTADILDFMKPWRDRLMRKSLRSTEELQAIRDRRAEHQAKYIDPKHDAMIEQEADDAPPGP